MQDSEEETFVFEVWCGECDYETTAGGLDEMELKAGMHMKLNGHTNINIVEQ